MQATAKRITETQAAVGEKKVKDLMGDKRRLVEVPYTASLAQTMNVLVANHVVAVPVAAPPGHWIGAGGSMIMESDKRTGVLRKHYIGMVTMLDILAHIAGDDHDGDGGRDDLIDLERKMAVPVSNIIGHNVEGLSLWTLNPNTSILDCMEIFSKGIHRALVPVDGQVEEAVGVELVESASSYRMLTQMDVLRFLRGKVAEIEGILRLSVKEMEGMMNENVMAITDKTSVIEAIKCMKSSFLNAVPIVGSTQLGVDQQSHAQLFTGRGKKLVGTFSATDLRGCHLATLQSWLHQTALEFTDLVRKSPLLEGAGVGVRELVTCRPESSLEEVMEKVLSKHVHRVWVTDEHGLLLGLISLSDMIRVIRLSLLSKIQT
ncbi:SNF1-related protein kinase regulatory subunit gamma-like PV42a [Cucumis melo var. makuwa]|uniref:SNF1-related protein kinase regulatory subunit gamma-like PV42a n=2 Tax=Cucumis melo TaxID=3656 RepID=A0A5A7TQS5_CUCMM|nr:SNF1-related protein kinase regulatory subunit gamma-like PV42a [Cucumis melo]KAA0044456.1 SNF1-related protein kinase regulatory subunit gamma-like PV42a [Cucumis melo var. makuwa]TYK29583.1 SNF1-related protein kinase regulatory subunit gamma-like PV42a [Cucumis melo var. makuwa]